ncbi:MAG: hypothetical protein QOJ68_921 [Blastococcus sp.]|jgi:hypothetical protein|nr:hypothetical protein [Blastococcus sp.]
MTALPQSPGTTRRWSAGRIVALVLGICLLLPGLGLLAGGGALLWVEQVDRNGQGFLNSTPEAFATPGYALSSERIDLATGADWLPASVALGRVQVNVTGTNGSPVFVGIAPVKEAAAYLAGVRHTVIADLGIDSSGSGTLVSGGAPAGRPGDQGFWVSKVSGVGSQHLSWSPEKGNWTLVVMNADASAGVAVQAGVGATVPALGTIAWFVLLAGLVVSLVGVLLIVLASRRRAGSPGIPTGGWAVPPPRSGPTSTAWRPPVPEPARRNDTP